MNLSICEGNTINIYVKTELSLDTKKIYENMKALGYDMLDINDPFYQDICTPYKSQNNTDILLYDRVNYISIIMMIRNVNLIVISRIILQIHYI